MWKGWGRAPRRLLDTRVVWEYRRGMEWGRREMRGVPEGIIEVQNRRFANKKKRCQTNGHLA